MVFVGLVNTLKIDCEYSFLKNLQSMYKIHDLHIEDFML